MLTRVVPAAVLAFALLGLGVAAGGGPQRVTLIGDSVSHGISLDQGAIAILGQGVDLQLETKPCRRLEKVSCPEADGTQPPTVLDLINSLGPALGTTVIVAVGYNDPETEYAKGIADVLAALHQAGVTHILWPTLRAARHPYLTMNDAIRAAAAADRSVTIVDWNLYSRSHPEWFQPDGIHLYGDGAQAMALLMHKWLVKDGVAPASLVVATRRLPAVRPGATFSVKLVGSGGTPPYQWSAPSLPHGLVLSASGSLSGKAGSRPTTLHLVVRVVDAAGGRAARSLALRIGR
jgi:hypothetical protein